MAIMHNSTLKHFVFRHYARSALIPLLTIELLLLVAYFGINYYTNKQTEKTLRNEVVLIMPALVNKEADLINKDFELITRQTRYFAEAHKALFDNPKAYRVIGDDPKFAIAPSKGLYQLNRKEWSSLFFTHGDKLTQAQKEKAYITAALDPLYKQMVVGTPNVVASYLNTPDNMNRLYPFIPRVYEQYPADLNMEDYNFYYMADRKHNPGGGPVWTGVYLDPAGHGWMLSCVAPVLNHKQFSGVVGLDVTVQDLVNDVLKQDLPWGATAFLTDKHGMILAMSPQTEGILGLKELKKHVYTSTVSKEQMKPEDYNILKNHNAVIANTFKMIYQSKQQVHMMDQVFVVSGQIPSTGWRLFVLVEQAKVLGSVNKIAYLSHMIGLIMIGIMVSFYLFFMLFLWKRAISMSDEIATPVAILSAAASELGSEEHRDAIPLCGVIEIDALTENFNIMSLQLDKRTQALVESEVLVKVQEKDAEIAFARGKFESASGYLHNVGNSITRLGSVLFDLNELVKSTEQYPAIFEKIANGSDHELFIRFRSVLLEKSTPKLKESVLEIQRIKENIQQTIRHQQQTVKDARESMIPVTFDLAELVRDVVSKTIPQDESFCVHQQIPEKLKILYHRNQMQNGIINIVKNAVEACQHSVLKEISISLEKTGEGIRLTVADNGFGIALEDRSRVMSAGFTTKPNGNGLGLHSFAIFLSANNGDLSLESDGPGQGAKVSMEVINV